MTTLQWHRGIGTDITPDMSVEDQLQLAGLNWQALTSPIAYGQWYGHTSQERQAIYRSDTGALLDVAGKHWTPFQNREIVQTFHNFCEGTGLSIDHLGSLEDGCTIFASANLLRELNIRKVGDIVRGRVLLFNYHKVGFGLSIRVQLERLVCTNGMTQPVRIGARSLTHVGHFDAPKVERILEGAYHNFENFGIEAEQLAATPISLEQATLLLIKEFGDPKLPVHQQPKIVETCLNLFQGQALGSDLLSAYHTAWGLLNSVTEYFNHRSQVRGGTATHLSSLLIGSKASKQNAFQQQLVGLFKV